MNSNLMNTYTFKYLQKKNNKTPEVLVPCFEIFHAKPYINEYRNNLTNWYHGQKDASISFYNESEYFV